MIIWMGSRLSRSNLTQLIHVFYSSLQSRENCLFWVWKFLASLHPLPCFMVLSKNLTECTIIIAAVVQLLSHVWLFVTSWTAAGQASLSLTISKSLPKFMSIELVMLSNHLILYFPLLLPSIFASIRVFSKVSIRWPKYWSFRNFSISLSNEYSGLISFRID